MSAASQPVCPSCGSTLSEPFHRETSVPTNSCLLLDGRDEARDYPRGDIELRICPACGFVTNARFDPALSEYSSRYEETQSFSARFNDFAQQLAKHWVDTYDLRDRTVLEIGCGKGEFLELMCEAGVGHGIGIDPGTHPERRQSEAASRIEWITDFYSEEYSHLAADAIVCRHTLEHIAPVGEFMRTVRAAIGDRTDTVVLFELPDVRRVLEEVAFWDVYYEHCSYFSAGSLARLFRSTGFDVVDLALDYDDQYLLIEARPSVPTDAEPTELPLEDDLDAVRAAAERFSVQYASTIETWRADLLEVRAGGGRAVIWGAGSKGVAYLTALGVTDEISCAVDINPHKHGRFMAGTGQEIVGPDALVELRPDLVVVMNSIYLDEIRADLASRGLHPRLVAV